MSHHFPCSYGPPTCCNRQGYRLAGSRDATRAVASTPGTHNNRGVAN